MTFLFVLQCIFWLTLILYFLKSIRLPLEKIIFSAALLLKVLAGCGVGWLYIYYYKGGDTLGYFHDAHILSNIFKESSETYIRALLDTIEVERLQYHAQDRALFFAKIASLISIFSLQNYWLIAISLSLFNFFAGWWFVTKLGAYFDKETYTIWIPFLFYPSILFWSSGLLKESVALSMIYILCGMFLQLIKQRISKTKQFFYLILSLFCTWLLWMLKYYYAAILLPCLLIALIFHLLKARTNLLIKPWQSLLIILPTLSILFIIFMQLHPNLHQDLILKAIVRNHDLSVAASDAGDYIQYESLIPTLESIVVHFPKAIFSGLFRPLPGEGNSLLHLLAGLENLLVLGLSIYAFYLILTKKVKVQLSPLLLASMIYIILLSGIVALASPNFGSLVRYKVAYAPFWLFLCLLVIQASRRFKSTSQSIKNM